MSHIVLSLFMVQATSSGLDVVNQIVLHAPTPNRPTIPATEHTLRLG